MTDPLEGVRAGALASAPTPLRGQDTTLDATTLANAAALPPPRGSVRDASIAALQDLAQRLGRRALATAEVQAAHDARQDQCDKRLDYHTLRRRFGSFGEALQAAGLTLAQATPPHSNLDCFANMEAVWRHHGRPPRMADINRAPSTVGSSAYQRRAGSWRAAVEAFAAFTGADPHRPGPPNKVGLGIVGPQRDAAPRTPSSGSMRTRAREARCAPLALRFQVLQRDRFRCTACGNSPARDPDCALQVDHILPRSKGGRSTLDNLRCLCASCNLGRGDRVEQAVDTRD